MTKYTAQAEMSAKDFTFEVTFNKHENKALKGFAGLTLMLDGKVDAFYNDLRVLETSKGFAIAEPVKYEKGEDGKPDYKKARNIYLLPISYKNTIISILKENKLI